MTICDYVRSYPTKIKDRFANSVGAIAISLPVGAILETAVAGMADGVSGKSRVFGGLFVTALLPGVLDLRAASREYFNATEGMRKKVHDNLLYFSIAAVYKVGAYIAAGEDNLGKIAVGTLATSASSVVLAQVSLGAGSLFETAYKTASEKATRTKRVLATTIIAGSIIATTAIYSAEWKAQQKTKEPVHIEYAITE